MKTSSIDGELVRRTVWISARTRKKRWARLWAFSYDDFAVFFGITEQAVRRAVAENRLNPRELQSVLQFWLDRVEFKPMREKIAPPDNMATTPGGAGPETLGLSEAKKRSALRR